VKIIDMKRFSDALVPRSLDAMEVSFCKTLCSFFAQNVMTSAAFLFTSSHAATRALRRNISVYFTLENLKKTAISSKAARTFLIKSQTDAERKTYSSIWEWGGEAFTGFWLGGPKVRDYWEDLGVGGRITLSCTLER
jgi:hypothetical protein